MPGLDAGQLLETQGEVDSFHGGDGEDEGDTVTMDPDCGRLSLSCSMEAGVVRVRGGQAINLPGRKGEGLPNYVVKVSDLCV